MAKVTEQHREAGREDDWADDAARQIVGFVWGKFPNNRIPKWDSELAAIIRAASPSVCEHVANWRDAEAIASQVVAQIAENDCLTCEHWSSDAVFALSQAIVQIQRESASAPPLSFALEAELAEIETRASKEIQDERGRRPMEQSGDNLMCDSKWADIASAPKDGTYILIWSGCWRHPFVGRYIGDDFVLIDGADADATQTKYFATHWQPLPLPPRQPEKGK